ncbi:FtsX-like permease family protein [Streptacidiphilus cavernicola]|uniref:FtsX-like permease family protein n=1 Tax=Streptacidiphilus cavernicola TaxID=3342716 RepID=A0ABV6W2L8_9ACTN
MNLWKRAWWRLTAHPGRTATTTGLFLVICALVLSGLLIRSAAARAGDQAKQSVGAVATLRPTAGGLLVGQAEELCRSTAAEECDYTVEAQASPTATTALHQPVPPPGGPQGRAAEVFAAHGVRDLGLQSAFRNGDARLVSGKGIGPDSPKDAVVIERRLAEQNHLKVGDRVHLASRPAQGTGSRPQDLVFTVGGIYADDTPDSRTYQPAVMEPADQLYLTPSGAARLLGAAADADPAAQSATFRLRDPADLARLEHDAQAAGVRTGAEAGTGAGQTGTGQPAAGQFILNDKAYQELVGPIDRTAGTAVLTVWLVALAGTAILALTTASALRERRGELGVLLSLGEGKPRLLGQQLVETGACALLGIALAALCSPLLAQAASRQLLSGAAAPRLRVHLAAADLAQVGAVGLGIAALATVLPGLAALRLTPRDILAHDE